MRGHRGLGCFLMTLGLGFLFSVAQAKPLIVGSKKFTESVVLAELLHQWSLAEGVESEHKMEIGGTKVLWNALLRGEIDIYPEYTGTLSNEILNLKQNDFELIKAELAQLGIGLSKPLGFNNTYALGLTVQQADRLGLQRISDLKALPDLRYGFTEEFFNRPDGWPVIKNSYGLTATQIKVLDHDLSYRGLAAGDLDVVDIYSTDPDIAYYKLKVLDDDLKVFPEYQALYIYRLEVAKRVQKFLKLVEGRIPPEQMIALSSESKFNKTPASQVAQKWLQQNTDTQVQVRNAEGISWSRFWSRTQEHLLLVFISLTAAVLVGVPLGVWAFRMKAIGGFIMGAVGVIQTIPALALLVLLIEPLYLLGLPTLGILPALIALFLYSLLPIVSSAFSGLGQIPSGLREVAHILNLSSRTRLFKIELPLAWPSILNGIKISAVLNVGFATLGALIGAGGYGQLILTGIRLDDTSLILQGALPAAALAILLQWGFSWLLKFSSPVN